MRKKLYRITALLLAACTAVSSFSMVAAALSWDGSSSGGGGGGSTATTKGFSLRYTDDNNCLGYRFSVVTKDGSNKVSKVIDVFRNTSNGNRAFGEEYRFNVKYNKKQLITYQNSGFSTSRTTANCYKESEMGFASSLPAPSGMGTWQQYTNNLNPVLYRLGISGGIDALKNGDKVLVEPLYDVRLQTVYHSVTTTELAIYGKWLLGAGSDGGSSKNSDTWGFISKYTNMHYPNALYTPDGQGLWSGVGPLSSRATFYNIINLGYGVGIAYTETKSDFTPNLKVNVCEAWRGSKSDRSYAYGTSSGPSFSNYSCAEGYPVKGDVVWFTVNFPAEAENIYVQQSIRLQGGNWASRKVYSNSNTWYDVQLSSSMVAADRTSYVLEAKVDWIDGNGNVLKYGAVKTFYIPVRPKINRYQVSMYDYYSGNLVAQGWENGSTGAVYAGQRVAPRYTYTSENPWTSYNNLQASLHVWTSGQWLAAAGGPDMSVNRVGINSSSTVDRYSSLEPYRVPDSSIKDTDEKRIPFLLTSAWDSDLAHTKESTWIDIPVVETDVELLDIKLIDEDEYYITGRNVWAYQKVTPQYLYRNNTSVRVYVEGYNDDTSKIPGVYAIDPGETIYVNGKEIEVPIGETLMVWGGVFLEGAGRLNTSWESNHTNNFWIRYWYVQNPLSIESIAPNSIYREGTQVITSFKVKNVSSAQFTPDSNISVQFTAKKGTTTLYSTTKSGIVVPGNNEQLVYFKWTVPSGLNGASITVQGKVLDNRTVMDTATRTVSSGKVSDSQTPDTDYEKEKPSGWYRRTTPTSSVTQATWSEWVYTNGAFQKKNYGMKISPVTVSLKPDQNSPSAEKDGAAWTLKSGYGVTLYSAPSRVAVSGYQLPSSSAYTAIQRGYVQLPEFGYSTLNGKYRTLQSSGGVFQFAANAAADGRKVHFLPVWYPDGDYQASCYFYDLWTPAGMVSARLNTTKLTVDGSMYDDWYVGRDE